MSISTKKNTSGTVKQITSLSNPIIKQLQALQKRKKRKQTGLFIAEGLKLVTDALQKNWPIYAIVYEKTVQNQEKLSQIAAKTLACGGLVLEVSSQILKKISRKDNPQLVLGIFYEHFKELHKIKKPKNNSDAWIALDRVRDPGNLGTIIRTIDAADAKGIILIGDTTDPFSLEAVRASMGSIFHVPITKCSENNFLVWSKKFPGKIIGTHLKAKVDYRTLDYHNPLIILMGNEQQGLSQSLSNICNQLVYIPMKGTADSLNLAVSTGIVLFEACKSS